MVNTRDFTVTKNWSKCRDSFSTTYQQTPFVLFAKGPWGPTATTVATSKDFTEDMPVIPVSTNYITQGRKHGRGRGQIMPTPSGMHLITTCPPRPVYGSVPCAFFTTDGFFEITHTLLNKTYDIP